jgi:hypothetical protein
MLGTIESGKTVYLHGLYAILSAGFRGYFLHAQHPDLDLDLTEAWELLLERGQLPQPTTFEPIDFPLVFRDGFTSLMNVNWLDYRGGAMSDRESVADARQLIERMARSDSVYLTIDGEALRDGWEREDIASVGPRIKASRMTRFVQSAAEQRDGQPPTLVVLITKSDLLRPLAETPNAAIDRSIRYARELLPIAFEQGTTTLVCPVSIGDIGRGNRGTVDTAKINPRWVHRPMVFSVLCYLETSCELAAAIERDVESRVPMLQEQLVALRGSVFGWFKREKRAQLHKLIEEAREDREAIGSVAKQRETRAARLFHELVDQAIFKDGVRQDLAMSDGQELGVRDRQELVNE